MDICEKMQLQALRIERFISQTLAVKEKAVQVGTVFICLATRMRSPNLNDRQSAEVQLKLIENQSKIDFLF